MPRKVYCSCWFWEAPDKALTARSRLPAVSKLAFTAVTPLLYDIPTPVFMMKRSS